MTTHFLLFVDDNENILDSLCRVFRGEDYNIRVATSAEEGLAILMERPADLIISDQRMPGLNGVEFLTYVKQKYPDTMRIILTGHADIDAAIAAINEGEVHRFITKPWNNEELKLIVKQALYQHDLILENRRIDRLLIKQSEKLKILEASLKQKAQESYKKSYVDEEFA